MFYEKRLSALGLEPRTNGLKVRESENASARSADCCTQVELSPVSSNRSVTPMAGVNRLGWMNFG
jgi:hypothetical protein